MNKYFKYLMLPLFCLSTLCACNNKQDNEYVSTTNINNECVNYYKIDNNTLGWSINIKNGSLVIYDYKNDKEFLNIPFNNYKVIYRYNQYNYNNGVLYDYGGYYLLTIGF